MHIPTPKDGLAWVTGASSGIGAALAHKLAEEGWRVIITARSADKLEALAASSGGRLISMPGDTTDAEAMERLVQEAETTHGPIVRAIFNAGIYEPVLAEDFDLALVHKTFRVNLDGTVNALAPAMRRMIGRRGGQLVIVSSVTGYGGLPSSSAYGATKAGLINLAESLKFDLDKAGVTIQVVNPGFVDTPATATNNFPMPFIVSADVAARRMVEAMAKGGFEITFPKRFTYGLKVLGLLPYPLYFKAVSSFTGWSKRPLGESVKK